MKALILQGESVTMRAAIYLRVSTTDQSTSRQERELRAAAARMGHEVVEVYEDFGISGGKGREKRPAFDRLHNDAARRQFDIVMAWRSIVSVAVCRISSPSSNTSAPAISALFLHQQGLDTTTPSGRAMFQMLGVFSEFERSIIRERVKSGMARAKTSAPNRVKPSGDHASTRPGAKRSAPPTRQAVSAYAQSHVSMVSPSRRCAASWPNNHHHHRLDFAHSSSSPARQN